jgi:methyl coenzyme M reductase alpha subunit
MGSLTPNAQYVYERNGEEIYAREVGAPIQSRRIIGYQYEIDNTPDPRTEDGRPLIEQIRENKLWGDIHREAKTNPALQKALDRAIMIYRLSKDKPQ